MGGDINNLCMGCMTFKTNSAPYCTHCGFREDAYAIVPHHLRPRTILNGKYLVGKAIGEGGFGLTYIGWDLNLEIKIALKEYYPYGFVTRDTTTDNDTVTACAGDKADFYQKNRERFVDEARRLARFYTLPGIVAVKDFFLENETAYIVMEYVDGVTMKQVLESSGGRLAEAQVLEMMKPLMNSLAEIHNAGVIHRDISPDNIMVTKEGNVKLLDFGSAREFSAGNETQTVLLKPGYAPEEQYLTYGEQDQRTDIYALCATMYRAIEGKPPPESLQRLHQDTLTGFSVPVSQQTQTAIFKGLAVLRENRWQSVPELMGVLYYGFKGPSALQLSLRKMAASLKRKKKPILAGFGVTFAVLAAFLAGRSLWGGGAVPASASEAPPPPPPSSSVASFSLPESSQPPEDPSVVKWNDSAFEEMVRKAMGKHTGDIRKEDLEDIAELSIRGTNAFLRMMETAPEKETIGNITSLEDIVNFPNLRVLEVSFQPISDISPLAGFDELVGLTLYGNRIRDISILADLPKLKFLDVGDNAIEDISPLTYLDELEVVVVSDNPIEDWTPLEHVDYVEGRPESASRSSQTSSSSRASSSSSSQSSAPSPSSKPEEAYHVERTPFTFITSKFTVKCNYTGDWKNGMPNGIGAVIITETVYPYWDVGDILSGEWVNGLLNGYGIFYGSGNNEGYMYEGNFKNGLKNGQGTMTGPNGEEWSGQWRDGEFIG